MECLHQVTKSRERTWNIEETESSPQATEDATRERDRVCVIRVVQSGCELYLEDYGALFKGFKKGSDMLRFVL